GLAETAPGPHREGERGPLVVPRDVEHRGTVLVRGVDQPLPQVLIHFRHGRHSARRSPPPTADGAEQWVFRLGRPTTAHRPDQALTSCRTSSDTSKLA